MNYQKTKTFFEYLKQFKTDRTLTYNLSEYFLDLSLLKKQRMNLEQKNNCLF